jgi:hypothetical protein
MEVFGIKKVYPNQNNIELNGLYMGGTILCSIHDCFERRRKILMIMIKQF